MIQVLIFSTINSILFGLLLFLLASGLTLIFSMMGVLNIAHAGFYMVGAYLGYQITAWLGFWPACILAPLIVGSSGSLVERFGLRYVHKLGHVAELLFTFGLSFVITELVQMFWGRAPVDYRVPKGLDFTAFRFLGTDYPAFRIFVLIVSVCVFLFLYVLFRKSRVGLILRASLSHPEMVGHLGHNVPVIFMTVFGGGTALAGLAGVLAGPLLVTQPSMAELFAPLLFVIVVVGGLGSLTGAFIASLLVGFIQTFAISLNFSLADVIRLYNSGYLGEGGLSELTLAQIAPVLPYLFMVLLLVVRPNGLMGRRQS